MLEMWNERYSEEGFAYGKKPNLFFKEQLDSLPNNLKILFPAEGEGRNVVYAALKGHQAFAFDISIEGKNKAEQLAKQENVEINYQVGQLDEIELEDQKFDVIVLVFAHFPPPVKSKIYTKLIEILKPNGKIILEGFSKTHLEYSKKNPRVGGPKKSEMLFSKEEIEKDFNDLNTLYIEETEVELNEGKYHNGLSSVVRFIGQKPQI